MLTTSIKTTMPLLNIAIAIAILLPCVAQATEWGNSGVSTWTPDKVTIGKSSDYAIRDIHIYSPFPTVQVPLTDHTPGIRLENEVYFDDNNI